MNLQLLSRTIAGVVLILCGNTFANADADGRPNVLFLAVDDMKDWVNCLGGYEGTVHTPNIDRLAAKGMLFANAHCPSPKCAPSRAAILTGLRPSTTGLYDNGHWWFPNLPDVVTMPMHFRKQGYEVVGSGKIFHHTAGNNPPHQWDDFFRLTFRNDPWFRGVKLNYPWSQSAPYPEEFPFSNVDGLGHENDWGSLSIPEDEYDDALSAKYAIDFLQKPNDKPFLLACGLFRPHLPWYVPKRFFEMYPISEVVLPPVKENDLEDVPVAGRDFASDRRKDFETILSADQWKEAVQAYLASISYADDQLGRILKTLDESPFAENTVVVLWSDHGWHLGEKGHWHKSTLWEEATRVPLIIDVPGYPTGETNRPVSLIDLFPTLCELCELPSIADHDGDSLVRLLQNPDEKWERPAIIEYRVGNVAVRSERYRYIRYDDDSEELYDLKLDPYEWNNLAADSDYSDVKKRLSKFATTNWAPSARTKKFFEFTAEDFSWRVKSTDKVIQPKR